MSTVAYVVLGKPVGQNRSGANGRPYGKTPAQRAFAQRLARCGLEARRRADWDTTDGPVEVTIRVVLENERPDTDGPVKAVLDSLEVSRPRLSRPGAGFLANDRQVRRYVVERLVDKTRPRVEVEVRELEP
jgi:Holliday junction resolvase RusA-like endonuclease